MTLQLFVSIYVIFSSQGVTAYAEFDYATPGYVPETDSR